MSIFKPTTISHLKQPMFLGESVDVARFDEVRLPWVEKLVEKQLGFFWRPEEVDLSKDRIDFNGCSEAEQFMFLSNLKYQTLLDSVQGRSPVMAFLPIVSLPELENWLETWSFSECLAEGTEVLTSEGWKDLGNTSVEDSCLVYDLDTDAVFFENPKRVVEYDMDTDLVEYQSKNPKQFNQLVTPNHRMPVIHRDKRQDGTQNRYFKEAIVQDYQSHHLAPISGFMREVEGNAKTITSLERLLIATQADGTISDRYTGERCGTIPIWFNLTKERKITRLVDICTQGNFPLTYLTEDKRDGSTRIKVDMPKTDIDPKLFSWVKLDAISVDWCKDFLYEVSHWDSHRRTTDKDDSFTYCTTVRGNSDTVQAIASLCGKSPRLTVSQDDRKESYKDTYNLNIIDSHTKDGQSIGRKLVPYKGKVRCLETSTGAFLIRYNGVVSVSGNTIHSRSYTHIIRNVFNDPTSVLDEITVTPEILARAASVTELYDELITMNAQSVLDPSVIDTKEWKKKVILTLSSVNVLEAVRFYVSFACSFSFAERSLMEGNAKVISLIARDEALHMAGTQLMLNHLRDGKDGLEWQETYEECVPQIKQQFVDAVNQEKEWAAYLFSHGSVIGLNTQILSSYIEYIADVRLSAIGLPKMYDTTTNPLPWTNSYLSSDNVQVAPQESEISSYLSGALNSTVDTSRLSKLSL
jgi:ribonucleotide reductase beta subunit family protein with ferritin-like domain